MDDSLHNHDQPNTSERCPQNHLFLIPNASHYNSQPTTNYNKPPSPKRLKKTSSGGRTTVKHPTYRGIRSRSGKWVSEIRQPKKVTRIWLGTYPSPEMAAAAYDVAVLALKGPQAALNFPAHVASFPVPSSNSPQDIRRAAAAAAELMRRDCGDEELIEDQPREGSVELADVGREENEFIDEEALFYMPNLLMDMAEGMLLSPPRMASPPLDRSPEISDAGTLWSYF